MEKTGGRAVIRSATAADAAGIATIYNHHVIGTAVTFEEDPVSVTEMARRITEIAARFPWLVCEADGAIAGYAYASPWKTRSAYRYSVETSIYVAQTHLAGGVGGRLYAALLDELRGRGLHVAIGGISLPNDASIRLHERLGFVKVGHFAAVGWKLGRWVDVGYWQLRLRSGASAPLAEPEQ